MPVRGEQREQRMRQTEGLGPWARFLSTEHFTEEGKPGLITVLIAECGGTQEFWASLGYKVSTRSV